MTLVSRLYLWLRSTPQGGEKQLVDAVIRRQVPAPPAIPVNVGAIVQNVGTAFAVYQAVMKNKPLFERYTSVTGKQVKNPGNFLVRIGTPFSQMIGIAAVCLRVTTRYWLVVR